ncbi:hypothetical protein BJV74DRAFT_799085 [Russula compacta]|nr:hypothetical protein BJV74DRAFT_799085 [Russula compacta]
MTCKLLAGSSHWEFHGPACRITSSNRYVGPRSMDGYEKKLLDIATVVTKDTVPAGNRDQIESRVIEKPQTPTPTEHVSHAPKIGGSEAGIVIAASAGIYFLLRYSEPSAADRTTRRRKYSIRRRGVRTHPLPIGLPGSLGEKLSSVFKGRRAGAGWVPARDDDYDDAGEWDTTDEPLREHRAVDRHDNEGDGDTVAAYHQQQQQPQQDGFLRVGSAPATHRATLTEATALSGTHKSRSASHVAAGAELSTRFGSVASPGALAQARSLTTPEPEGEWLDASDARGGVGGGGSSADNVPSALGFFAPQPRRADSGHEIQLFAGGTQNPF